MTKWFFYENNQKYGPVTDQQLQQFAMDGRITPETVVETEAGRWPAKAIKGINFPADSPLAGLSFSQDSAPLNFASSQSQSQPKTRRTGQRVSQSAQKVKLAAFGLWGLGVLCLLIALVGYSSVSNAGKKVSSATSMEEAFKNAENAAKSAKNGAVMVSCGLYTAPIALVCGTICFCTFLVLKETQEM